MKNKYSLTRQGAIAVCATAAFLRPRLAQDASLNLLPVFADITAKNFGSKKGDILRRIDRACRGKIAIDTTLGEVAEFLDMLDAHGDPLNENDEMPEEMEKPVKDIGEKFAEPDVMDADPMSAVEGFLKDKLSEADLHHVLRMLSGAEEEEEEEEMAPDHAEGEAQLEKLGAADITEPYHEKEWRRGSMGKQATDQPMKFRGSPRTGGKMAGDTVTREEMEAALRASTETVRRNERDIREAERFVQPWVGQLNMSFDSAEQVYRQALKMRGVRNIDKVHPSALPHLLNMQPKPGAKRDSRAAMVAADSGGSESSNFMKRFPDAARIRLT